MLSYQHFSSFSFLLPFFHFPIFWWVKLQLIIVAPIFECLLLWRNSCLKNILIWRNTGLWLGFMYGLKVCVSIHIKKIHWFLICFIGNNKPICFKNVTKGFLRISHWRPVFNCQQLLKVYHDEILFAVNRKKQRIKTVWIFCYCQAQFQSSQVQSNLNWDLHYNHCKATPQTRK